MSATRLLALWTMALLLTAWWSSAPAYADELRPGYLELTQKSSHDWRMVWKAPIKGGLATNATPILPKTCSIGAPQRQLINAALVSVWQVRCASPLVGQMVGLTGLDATFTDALVRIAPLGRAVQAARLTAAAAQTLVLSEPSRAQVGETYFKLGVGHILSGYDHLLFVLSLVLLIGRGWQVAKTVTAFTVAHSLTLMATSLHWLSINRKPVEICIALSIVFLAVEIVKARPQAPRLAQRLPWLVAFIFGLLHGFGFAAALAEVGLPEAEVPLALLTFNLGVEAGQLLIVGAGVAVLGMLRRYAPARYRPAQTLAAYAIGITASNWLIERMLS